MPAKTPLAGDKINTPAAGAVPFRPYCRGAVTRTRNVCEYMLEFALCLVITVTGARHLAPPLGVTPFEFRQDFWHQKTRDPALSCGNVCLILHSAVSVEHQLVTDRWSDGQTDT